MSQEIQTVSNAATAGRSVIGAAWSRTLQLPFFTGKTVFSKAAHNIVISVINSLLRLKIVRGSKDAAYWSDGGLVIELQKQTATTSTGGNSTGTQLQRFRVKVDNGDYLTCTKILADGTEDEEPIPGSDPVTYRLKKYFVLKPEILRTTITSRTIKNSATPGDAVTWSFSYSTIDTADSTVIYIRTATATGYETETQVQKPIYGQGGLDTDPNQTPLPDDGDDIFAVEVQWTDGDYANYAWLDVNQWARRWETTPLNPPP